MTTQQYTNSTRVPVRFGKLFPNSLFRIVSEPSRNIRRSRDNGVYRLSEKGFYGENVADGTHVVLDFDDIVQPVKVNK